MIRPHGPAHRDPAVPITVALSPLHRVELAEACAPLLETPPERDFALHTIALKKAPDGRPLVHSELVIAGRVTRERFPAAREFPVHFLKSFHPWTLHGDPAVEFARTGIAASILGSPPPVGHDANSFRTTFIPGRPLSRLLLSLVATVPASAVSSGRYSSCCCPGCRCFGCRCL